jgi:hypothetical protein
MAEQEDVGDRLLRQLADGRLASQPSAWGCLVTLVVKRIR